MFWGLIVIGTIAFAGDATSNKNNASELNATLAVIQGNSVKGSSGPLSGPETATETITEPFDLTSALNSLGSNREIIECLIACESGGNPKAYNQSSGCKGILQFTAGTWSDFAPEGYDIWNGYDQIKVADYMISRGLLARWECAKQCN